MTEAGGGSIIHVSSISGLRGECEEEMLTVATDAAARVVSERALQAFLGHAGVRSTRRYARMADGALLEAPPARTSRTSGKWWQSGAARLHVR